MAKLISFFFNVTVSNIKNLLGIFAPMFIHEVPGLKNKIGSKKIFGKVVPGMFNHQKWAFKLQKVALNAHGEHETDVTHSSMFTPPQL